ncbi:hypothetical protein AR437_05535 [Christensenella hongkongensis]|nr:hypothetical protein AR437_05535 [Christensenella hongkongensis]
MEGNAYFLCGKRGEKMANTNKKPDWWYDKKRWQGMPGGGPATGGNQKQEKKTSNTKTKPSGVDGYNTSKRSEPSRPTKSQAKKSSGNTSRQSETQNKTNSTNEPEQSQWKPGWKSRPSGVMGLNMEPEIKPAGQLKEQTQPIWGAKQAENGFDNQFGMVKKQDGNKTAKPNENQEKQRKDKLWEAVFTKPMWEWLNELKKEDKGPFLSDEELNKRKEEEEAKAQEERAKKKEEKDRFEAEYGKLSEDIGNALKGVSEDEYWAGVENGRKKAAADDFNNMAGGYQQTAKDAQINGISFMNTGGYHPERMMVQIAKNAELGTQEENMLAYLSGTGQTELYDKTLQLFEQKKQYTDEAGETLEKERDELRAHPLEMKPEKTAEEYETEQKALEKRLKEERSARAESTKEQTAKAGRIQALQEQIDNTKFLKEHAVNYGQAMQKAEELRDYEAMAGQPGFEEKAARGKARLAEAESRSTGEFDPFHEGNEVVSQINLNGSSYATDEQKDVFYAIYDDKGLPEALNYLDLIRGEVSAKAGAEVVEAIKEKDDPWMKRYMLGTTAAGAGLESFLGSMRQTTDLIRGSTLAVEDGMYNAARNEYRPELTEVDGLWNDVVYNVSNAAPAIAAGAVNPIFGTAVSAANAFGGAVNQSLKEGKPVDKAVAYGAAVGVLEGTTQYLIGGISKLGGMEKTAEKFLLNSNKVIENTFKSKAGQGILKYLLQQGIDSGGEFTQESMQSFLEPVLRNLIFGENNEIKLFTEEQLYSGLVGALTSIVANGAGKGMDAMGRGLGITGRTGTQTGDMESAGATNLLEGTGTPILDSLVGKDVMEGIKERTGHTGAENTENTATVAVQNGTAAEAAGGIDTALNGTPMLDMLSGKEAADGLRGQSGDAAAVQEGTAGSDIDAGLTGKGNRAAPGLLSEETLAEATQALAGKETGIDGARTADSQPKSAAQEIMEYFDTPEGKKFTDAEGRGEVSLEEMIGKAAREQQGMTQGEAEAAAREIVGEMTGERNGEIDDIFDHDIMKEEDFTIQSRNNANGNPNAILHMGADLNNRQKRLIEKLPDYDSRIIVKKSEVSMIDLAAMTTKTGVEFAMFTKGGQRMIVRGNKGQVNINPQMARELAEQGYKWSGHTHPGTNDNCLIASDGDKVILSCFGQEIGYIYNSKGQWTYFERSEKYEK